MKNLIGKRFGNWVVLKEANKKNYLFCKCDCGTEKDVNKFSLLRGDTKSCGCKRKKMLDKEKEKMIGKKYGKLTAIKVIGSNKNKNTVYLFKCDCGNFIKLPGKDVKYGNTRSCGCLLNEYYNDKIKNLIGKKIENLTILEKTNKRKHNGSVIWKCQCDCGNIVFKSSLELRKTKSCGCIFNKVCKENGVKQIKKLHEEYVENTNLKNIRSNKARKDSYTGIKGVYYEKRTGKYRANLTFKGIQYHLGIYSNIEDAIKARKQAEEKYFEPILEKYKNKEK